MTSLSVAVGSTNPVKLRATEAAVRLVFGSSEPKVLELPARSGVADQPYGDDETLRGARNRADAARVAGPSADLWIGLEGGVAELSAVAGALECMAWAVVLGEVDGELRRGESRTATFTLPVEIADLVRSGLELGEATDRVFDATDTKRGSGTVGPLTGGVIDRTSYYAHALVLALIPFRNPSLTFPG